MGVQIEGGLFYGACPVGTILPFCKTGFFGIGVSIPNGWIECDGTAIPSGIWAGLNTPDLRNVFLRGGAASGASGGVDTHTHTNTVSQANRCGSSGAVGTTSYANCEHIHTVTIAYANNIPVYYGVVFILGYK
jgi:hypothetical protein